MSIETKKNLKKKKKKKKKCVHNKSTLDFSSESLPFSSAIVNASSLVCVTSVSSASSEHTSLHLKRAPSRVQMSSEDFLQVMKISIDRSKQIEKMRREKRRKKS